MMIHDIPKGSLDQRDPSVLDTAIRVESIERLDQLRSKLEEYEERKGGEPQSAALSNDTPYSVLRNCFKEMILRYVISEVESGRDTAVDNPVVITELASHAHDLEGVHLGDAVTTPFVYDADALTFRPDFAALSDGPLLDRVFSEAYAIIMSYANDGGFNVGGGSGLPQPTA